MNSTHSAYAPHIHQQIGRLVSSQDREPFSLSYGSFDRSFWAWKFTDFPGARFQEGVYALAHLHRYSVQNSPMHQDERVFHWAEAGLSFWRQTQYPDGSFDEAYPGERSLAATAFSAFYLGQALRLLYDDLGRADSQASVAVLAKAGDWLSHNDETHGILSNHLAAAAAALEVIFRVTGEEKYQRRSTYFLNQIYRSQSREGWYEEYGGADPGYQTHATFYLAHVWQHTRDEQLLQSLTRSVAFLKYFIHPNGTLGGEYGSRNTQFYFPAGFEMLGSSMPDAALIARFMRRSVAEQTGAGLSAVDRYNFLPMFNNYLFADLHSQDLPENADMLPWQQEGEWDFPDAGLAIRSSRAYYAVAGLSKGGILRVYRKPGGMIVASDCGYWARMPSGKVVSSQALARPVPFETDEHTLTVNVPFIRVNQKIMSSWPFVAFRLFSLTIGRNARVARWLKRLLVGSLVTRRETVPMWLTRRITFRKASVEVADQIECGPGVQMESLWWGARFATVHMGSSRYFEAQELELDSPGYLLTDTPDDAHIVRSHREWVVD